LTATRHPETDEVGFSLRVGGGLSTDPRFGTRLDAFIRWDQVLLVVRAVSELFRDSDVLREHREKARLKFLFLGHGWDAARFQEELEVRLRIRLARGGAESIPVETYRDHLGIHAQRQAGLEYVGVPVLRGRLTPEAMRAVAELADRYGNGELRTTIMQNLVIPHVPRQRTSSLARELASVGLPLDVSPFRRGTIACTGTEFCKLALTETKGFAQWVVEELERRLPGFDQHLRLHVTGCPNSCGQHWIADLGIEGKKTKVNGRLVDAYYFCVGGGVGPEATIARPVGYRIPTTEVPAAVERLLRAYLDDRLPGQTFREFCATRSDEDLRAFLAGGAVVAVTRDAPAARPPHGVDG
jgi:sulfite reductase (ferredoxin)